MNVLIIPEDFRNDQYILKPLFSRLVRTYGRPSVHILICRDPLLGGVVEALKSERMAEIIEKYGGMIDIFILCVDRDGREGRRQRLNQLEAEFGNNLPFLAENAWEEIEAWVLAGLNLPSDWSWAEVRAEVDVKERYFEPFATQLGVSGSPGRGRKPLAEEASRNIDNIRMKCPEDFDSLARRLETAVQAG